MAIGRPRKVRLNNSDFKEYLLRNLIDENGCRVSIRKLMSTEKFKENVATFKSVGTLSNWMYRFLVDSEPYKGRGVREDIIYDYGVKNNVISVPFDTWRGVKTPTGKAKVKTTGVGFLKKLAKELGSSIMPIDANNDLELFTDYLKEAFTEKQMKDAIRAVSR